MVWQCSACKEFGRSKHTKVYKKWRQSILLRDNFTCQFCNKRGGRLEVDHIKPLVLLLNENNIDSLKDTYKCDSIWDVKNGRVLCYDCHQLTKKGYGTKKV